MKKRGISFRNKAFRFKKINKPTLKSILKSNTKFESLEFIFPEFNLFISLVSSYYYSK